MTIPKKQVAPLFRIKVALRPVAANLTVDSCTPRLSSFKIFQNKYAGALGNNARIAVEIEWAARVRWIAVSSRTQSTCNEAGHRQRRNRCVRTAHHRNFGFTGSDQSRTDGDGVES